MGVTNSLLWSEYKNPRNDGCSIANHTKTSGAVSLQVLVGSDHACYPVSFLLCVCVQVTFLD